MITAPLFQLLLLAITTGALSFGRSALGPLQETVRVALALSDDQIALLQGAALALPIGLASIPAGYWTDRYSRARLLLVCAAMNVLGTVLTAVAPGFITLFCARCLVGLAIAGMGPAALSLISDLFASTQRGRAMMVMLVGSIGGMSAAFGVGGYLLKILERSPDSWRSAMLWLACPLAVALLLTAMLREPARAGRTGQQPLARGTLAELWRYRAVIAPLLVGFVVVSIGDVAALVWAAPTLSRTFGLSADHIGAVMAALLLVSGLLGPIAGGMLSDVSQRLAGPQRTMRLLAALAALSIPASFFAVMPTVMSSAALLLVFMTAGYAISTMTSTLAIIVIPNELRGVCIALFNMGGGIVGIAVAPLLVSLLSRAIGGPQMIGQALAIVGTTTALIGAVAFGLGRLSMPRRAAAW